MSDRFEDIVNAQRMILDRWHDLSTMDQVAKEQATFVYLAAITAEIGEILNGDDIKGVKGQGAIRWKPWKNQVVPADPDYIKTELIDIFHFTLEMLLIWGCDADEIHKRYLGKNKENLERYKNGY